MGESTPAVLDFTVPVRNRVDGRESLRARSDDRIRVVLFMAAIGWYVLQSAIIADEGSASVLRRVLGRDWKGKVSPLIYLGAIGLAFVRSWIAIALYSFAAVLWLVPDRRFERALRDREE